MSQLPDFVHLRLRLRECRQLVLQFLHLRLELGGLRIGLVNLRAQLRDVVVELGLLGLRLGRLFIAICLLAGLRAHLLLELRNHVRNEILHFAERVSASELNDGGDARGELGQSGRVVGFREPLDQDDDFGLTQIGAAVQLEEGIALRHRACAGLLQDLLRLGQRLQLLPAGEHGLLVVRSDLHARGLAGREGLHGVRQLLLAHLQVTLIASLGLLGRGLGRLLIAHVLVVHTHLVLQGLLQHLEVVVGVDLGLAEVAQLALRLLLQVL
mmetsp:Transcript_89808/g.242592  ORF Transcript_89808/g.242592 Transcript_89808/m.242592 type:complete len:269 (+) Transcript_89808:711-1517(+)